MNRPLAYAASLVFGLTGIASLAQAQTASYETAEVRFADLNLSSQAGQAALDRRIEGAARRVCEAEPPVASRTAGRSERNRCKTQVRQQVAAVLTQ